MKQKVCHHASVAVVFSECRRELLFDQYTETYRIPDWRGCINLIGGNQSSEDSSPKEIWEREIVEEFQKSIAENLITHAKPYKDFLVKTQELMEFRNDRLQVRDPLVVMTTVFETFLDQEIFEFVRHCLQTGKEIKNEGGLVIQRLENLKNGAIRSASATGLILEDYLRHFQVSLSTPKGVVATCLGTPRNSLEEYFSDFEYEFRSPDEKI